MSTTESEFREKVVGRAVDAMAEVGRERGDGYCLRAVRYCGGKRVLQHD